MQFEVTFKNDRAHYLCTFEPGDVRILPNGVLHLDARISADLLAQNLGDDEVAVAIGRALLAMGVIGASRRGSVCESE